ncbi:MAG: hypothetical protein NTZ74_08920 [Chloroflexi bacterium]|nr:hypothetical protein [Chloroflexota bacterium]
MKKYFWIMILFFISLFCLGACDNFNEPTSWPTQGSTTKTAQIIMIHKTAISLYLTETAQPSRTPAPTVIHPTLPPDSGNTNQTYSNSSSDTSWFTGGNLHKSTVKEWRNATYANRLATSADYVVGYLDITDFSDMATIKQEAKDLETCISTTASGGDADNEEVSFIGAMCLVLLFPK